VHPCEGPTVDFQPATTNLEALTIHADRTTSRHPIIGYLATAPPDEPDIHRTFWPAVIDTEMAGVIAANDLRHYWTIVPADAPDPDPDEIDFAMTQLHRTRTQEPTP
jgi:hypothetical protein